jgi:hypothetical protein
VTTAGLPAPPLALLEACIIKRHALHQSRFATPHNEAYMMTILAPRTRTDGESVMVSAEFQTTKHKNVLWFRLEAKYQDYVVSERGDAFLTGLLPYAMARGEDIQLDCPISEKLYYNLTHFLIPAFSLANPKLRPIKLIPTTLDCTRLNIGHAVGTGFSGGVDSFCTIYDHFINTQCPSNYRLTHLAFFNVGSHGDCGGEAARALFSRRLHILKQFPVECGLDFIVVDSNISEILQLPFTDTGGIRTMTPVLLLQKLFRVYYFSSAYRMDALRLTDENDGYYGLLTAAMLSTESLDFYSFGEEYTRVQKTALIANYEPSTRYLNVCTNGDDNCSCCWKCMRTLLTLDILGAIDRYAKVFDLSLYQTHRASYISEVLENQGNGSNKEIYNEMLMRGFPVPVVSRLHLIKRRFKSRLKKILAIQSRNVL